MVVQTHPKVSRGPALPSPGRRVVETRSRRAKLHLVTYLVGNALFWILCGAIAVSADHWYWWPLLPSVGWALVLTLHFWHVYRN